MFRRAGRSVVAYGTVAHPTLPAQWHSQSDGHWIRLGAWECHPLPAKYEAVVTQCLHGARRFAFIYGP